MAVCWVRYAGLGECSLVRGAEGVQRLGKAVVVDVAIGGVGACVADVGVAVDGEAVAERLCRIECQEGRVLVGRVGME